ncbi:MAG TPA: hypothetical protein VHQ23_12680 [Ilumatobacteraceae bacterium]|nr:hypothetical protein [Ilumatobacteraceae bacterium]
MSRADQRADRADRSAGPAPAPAFYAQPAFASRPAVRDWWTLLHPPYTAWHLSYVVIGACLVGPVDAGRLGATVLAFFLAVGIGAHALDELHGRPLATSIPARALVAAAVIGIGGAAIIGVIGIARIGLPLIAFIVIGVLLAVGYNLELFGGRLHTDFVFAAAWGAFPVLTAYYAQHEQLDVAAVAAAVFAFFLSSAQRSLSTPARSLRRKTADVYGTVVGNDGTTTDLDRATLLGPLESALRALSWAAVSLAVTLAFARLRPWP